MDDLIITIERRLNGEVLRIQQRISASALIQEKEPERMVEYVFLNAYREFSKDYDMEKDNQDYSPKGMSICGQPPYNYYTTVPINNYNDIFGGFPLTLGEI